MKLAFNIAKRYFFSKKSHTAINIISMVSVCGILVATLALVCTLSVFNGFTSVVTDTFSAFDPQLQIVPVKGKVFDGAAPEIQKIKQLPSIALASESLEENALLKFGEKQQPALLKGVSPQFSQLADINKLMIDGKFQLTTGDVDYVVPGGGLAVALGVTKGFLEPIGIYIPLRTAKVNPANPATAFRRADVFVSGVFALNQSEYDDHMLIVSIKLLRRLLSYTTQVSSIDLKIKKGYSLSETQQQIQSILGKNYEVRDRFQQQKSLYRMVNIEKWVTFLILAIILTIAAFNIVGSLTMLIIDKKQDITIFKNLGANNRTICRIFLFEGWIITAIGAIGGIVIGLIICLLQQHFGFLKLGNGDDIYVINAYPVVVNPIDIIVIFVTVNLLGYLAVLYPVHSLRKKLKTNKFAKA